MPVHDLPVVRPNWSAPKSVVAFTTTTAGGVSECSYASLNLGDHVGDNPEHVAENRKRLQQFAGGVKLCWLQQTHSDIVVNADEYVDVVEGDASVTTQSQRACVIMTADCLPVLLCNQLGTRVAAIHCGWKGLYQDLIRQTIETYFSNDRVIAWLGPAIAQQSYEVDEGLYQRFVAANPEYGAAFNANRSGHYLMNLYTIAKQQLLSVGVVPSQIFGGEFDTFTDLRYFSHRRNAKSGRIASIIYLQ